MRSTRFKAHASIRLPTKIQQQRLHRVIREELTELQRNTVIAYYFRELTMEQIARERRVNKSTVSRTLRRAEDKLRRFLQY
jgi:RNA polymerase sigma factor (sigma-70 family)